MKRGRIHFDAQLDGLPVIDLERLQGALRAVMDTAGQFAKALWYQRAQDLNIRNSGAYLQGIQDATVELVEERNSGGDLQVVIVIRNTAPHAAIVEDGHPAFHLPDRIDWASGSAAIRRAADGTPYLRIPFRHGAFAGAVSRVDQGLTMGQLRSMMPSAVYADAKRLTFSARGKPRGKRGTYHDPTPGPRFVAGAEMTERWRAARTVAGRDASGNRLTNPAWQTAKHQGLFKTGSKGNAQYLTVRTLTPQSAGWNIPAQLGHGVARQVAYVLNSGGAAGQRFQDLLAETARNALRGGTP